MSAHQAPDLALLLRTVGPGASVWRKDAWTIATNGLFLVALPVHIDMEGAAAVDWKRRHAGNTVLANWPTTWHRTDDGEQLEHWARIGLEAPAQCACCGTGQADCWRCRATKRVKCACKCGGASHEVDCDECDNTGLRPCGYCGLGKARPGVLMGEVIDRSLLARLLGLMPSGPTRLFLDRERMMVWLDTIAAPGAVAPARGVVALMRDMRPSVPRDLPSWPAALDAALVGK